MPQIELMQSDLPHTLFNTKKKGKEEVDEEAIRLQKEANRRALKRRNMQGAQQSYTLEEVFAGAAD